MGSRHKLTVTVNRGGDPKTFDKILSFQFTNDMLELVDAFGITAPMSKGIWDACQPDNEIEFFFDDVRFFNGFIDDRSFSAQNAQIQIRGRDRGGRLVDESAALLTFKGETIESVAKKIGVTDWFQTISFNNAKNRKLLGGRLRRLAVVAREPTVKKHDVRKKVEPGQTIAAVLLDVLEEAGLLAWTSADGTELIIGKPTYSQAAQWDFFNAKSGSDFVSSPNLIDVTITESVAERYSQITVCGASKGDSAKYGKNVMQRRATVYDIDSDDGTGDSFAFRKRLLISDSDVRSQDRALDRALREQALRDSSAFDLQLVVDNWSGPTLRGDKPVFFHYDKLLTFEDEETGIRDNFLITRVDYAQSEATQSCVLTAVPNFTELRAA